MNGQFDRSNNLTLLDRSPVVRGLPPRDASGVRIESSEHLHDCEVGNDGERSYIVMELPKSLTNSRLRNTWFILVSRAGLEPDTPL
jgi:hypothetical protein